MKTPRERLDEALAAADWNANVLAFRGDTAAMEKLANSALRLAVWAKQFEVADKSNPALSFIREMQVSSQHAAALAALALYKPAASTMRSMVECALYYTYFRTHPAELATLIRDNEFYLDKAFLLKYHQAHTPDFSKLEALFGLVGKLNSWYKQISSITHGQIPGRWVGNSSLTSIKMVAELLAELVEAYCQAVAVIDALFLCSTGRELWNDFSSDAKRKLLHGMSGDVKQTLNLHPA